MKLSPALLVTCCAALGLALVLAWVGGLGQAWQTAVEDATQQPTPTPTRPRGREASPDDRIEGTVLAGSPSTFLEATPIFVVADSEFGSLTLTWDTGLSDAGELYVSRNDGPEVLVSWLASGSSQVSWISLRSSYVFHLYSGHERTLMLATLTVSQDSVGLVSLEEWADLAPWRSTTPDPSPDRAMAELGVPVLVLCGLLAAAALYAHSHGQAESARRLLIAVAIVSILLSAGSPWASEPRPFDQQPTPDAPAYADSALNLAAGRGYTMLSPEGQRVRPPYPPGFPLALAPFSLLRPDYPAGAQLGATALASLYALVSAASGWLIGGPLAAAVVAWLQVSSPFARDSATLVLADAFGATLTVLSFGLTGSRPALAGFLAGVGVLVRANSILNPAALLLAVRGAARRQVVLGLLPALAILGLVQWLAYGDPLQGSYRGARPLGLWSPTYALYRPVRSEGPWVYADQLGGRLFEWICPCGPGGPQAALPNLTYYPVVLSGLFWIYAPPLVTVCGLIYAWLHRRDPTSAFALWLALLSLLFFVLFRFQGARFMASPATVLTILAAVAIVRWLERSLERPSLRWLARPAGERAARE